MLGCSACFPFRKYSLAISAYTNFPYMHEMIDISRPRSRVKEKGARMNPKSH